jgi:mono/diheme cytochrome c family protein
MQESVGAIMICGTVPLRFFPISIDFRRAKTWHAGGFVVTAARLAVMVSSCLAGCHAKPSLTPQQAEGKHLFEVGCAHCHEENDLHLKNVPPDLHGLFDRQTLPDGTPATDVAVEQVLLTGKGMMPSFAYQMNKQQMDALVAYLHIYVAAQK